MKLIAGLGNPGREYAGTRHNLGFAVVDALAAELAVSVGKRLCRALVGAGVIGGQKVVLAKPQTYMNLSGQAVAPLLSWYRLGPDDLLVVLDDFDLPPGRVRLRPDGTSGGHKGLASVIEALGTDRFARLRLGTGRPPGEEGAVAWALGHIPPHERETIDAALKTATAAAAEFVTGGLSQAMNRYNAMGPVAPGAPGGIE